MTPRRFKSITYSMGYNSRLLSNTSGIVSKVDPGADLSVQHRMSFVPIPESGRVWNLLHMEICSSVSDLLVEEVSKDIHRPKPVDLTLGHDY